VYFLTELLCVVPINQANCTSREQANQSAPGCKAKGHYQHSCFFLKQGYYKATDHDSKSDANDRCRSSDRVIALAEPLRQEGVVSDILTFDPHSSQQFAQKRKPVYA
jgi:hypothetical protein